MKTHYIRRIRFTLFLLVAGVVLPSSKAHSEIWKDHAAPTLEQGFDRTGWILIGSGILATALAQPQDQAARNAWNNDQRMSHDLARAGDVAGMGIPGIAIALTQLWLDPEAGKAHAEALIDTFLVTSILKQANQRSRPGNAANKQSMPSGHTSTTFASATSLTYFYGWKAAVPAYSVAVITGLSRLSDDAHWLSDTVAGAFIGIFWGRATALHHLNLPTPIVGHNLYGLGWGYKF